MNRWWTLTGGGVTFTTYSATFTFGRVTWTLVVDPLHVVVEGYAAGVWTPEVTGTRTLTSTQATGVDSFGDFTIGEPAGSAHDHFVVSAPPTATAGSPFDVTVTAVDSVGNTLINYTGTITFVGTDTYAVFSPVSYAFQPGDLGTRTFPGGAVAQGRRHPCHLRLGHGQQWRQRRHRGQPGRVHPVAGAGPG